VIETPPATRAAPPNPAGHDEERLQQLLKLQSEVVALARQNEQAERLCAALRQEFGQASRRAGVFRLWFARWLARGRA
jgi:hypothetical protein